MYKLKNFSLQTALLDGYEDINRQLLDGLNTYIDDTRTRKSHHFMGRYENIYIDNARIPALSLIINNVKEIAAEILHVPSNNLKAGLWFNVMNPGDKTTRHQHDDDDELLSAVYYIKVPENSGNLKLGKIPVFTEVTPREGMFVFFPPELPHEVTENLSDESRVSLGINIGPVTPDL